MQDGLDKAGIKWRNEKSKTSIKTKIKEYAIIGIILFILGTLGLVGQSSDLLISSSHSGGEWLASFHIMLGADVNAENNGWTPLMWAARDNPNLGFFRVLIDKGADINAKSLDGATSLNLAVLANPNPEVVWLLIDAGADVSEKDVLLYYASKNENLKDTDYNLLKEKILALEKTGKEKGKQ